jgi:hypothetical protein
MPLRDNIHQSFVARWFVDYVEQLFVIVVVFASAVCLDILEHYCKIWGSSDWLIEGIQATAKFMFRCDQFFVSAIVVFGMLVALFDYVKKGLLRAKKNLSNP